MMTMMQHKQKIIKKMRLFSTVFILLMSSSVCHARQYSPSIHDTLWRIDGDVFRCYFRQPIANFGFATFEHEAGEEVFFYLESQSNLLQGDRAQLSIEA